MKDGGLNVLDDPTILTCRHKYVVTICESEAAFRKIELVRAAVKFFETLAVARNARVIAPRRGFSFVHHFSCTAARLIREQVRL